MENGGVLDEQITASSELNDNSVAYQGRLNVNESVQESTVKSAGNTDENSIVLHDLIPPIRARYIRFRPTAWHQHISMRVELYGCCGTIS